jgi:hypothetical protein
MGAAAGEAGAAGAAGAAGEPGATSFDCSPASGEAPSLTVELVADGFDEPLLVLSPPGDMTRLFVLEQAGTVRIIEEGATLPEPLS